MKYHLHFAILSFVYDVISIRAMLWKFWSLAVHYLVLQKCIYYRLCLAFLYTDVIRLMTCHFCTWHYHLKLRQHLLTNHLKASKPIDTCFIMRGYSSVVEHSTADREVHGSTPCAPFKKFCTRENLWNAFLIYP